MSPAKARPSISNTLVKKKSPQSGVSSKAAPTKASKSPEEDHNVSQLSPHGEEKKPPKAAIARKQSKSAKELGKRKSQVEIKTDKEALSRTTSPTAPVQRKSSQAAKSKSTGQQEPASRRASHAATATKATGRAVSELHRPSLAAHKATGQQEAESRRASHAVTTTKATGRAVSEAHRPSLAVHKATSQQEPTSRRTSHAVTTTKATGRAVSEQHRPSLAAHKATGQQEAESRRASHAVTTTKASGRGASQAHRPSLAVHGVGKEVASKAQDQDEPERSTAIVEREVTALKERPDSDKPSPDEKNGGARGGRTPTKSSYGTYAYATVVVAGVLVLALAYAAMSKLHRTTADDSAVCKTLECQEAAEYLKKVTVATHAPCADFYSRVCGTWTAPGTGFIEDLMGRLLRKLNASLFETQGPLDEEAQRRGMHIVLPLYRNCYRYMQQVSNIRDEVAHAEVAVNVRELFNATSFADIVRFMVRTSLHLGFYTIFDVRFVREGDRDMLELRRGYSLQAKVGSEGASDAKFRISKLVSSWLGVDNPTDETELLFRIDDKVTTAFTQSLPESQSPLHEVTEGVLTLTADEWAKAINDAHDATALKLQASDTVINTNMASVRRACESMPSEGVNATAFYIATNLVADVIYVVYSKLDSSTSPLHQVVFCVYLVRLCFTATWPLLTAELLGEPGSTPALKRIFTSLQQAAKTPNALTWMDDKEREVAAGIIANTSLLVVSANMTTVSKPDYTGPSRPFEEDSDAFLLTYARARRHHYNAMLRSPPTRTELTMTDMEGKGQLVYLPPLQSLFVPTLLQRSPYVYASGVPDRYNYGTVGGVMATRLIDAVVKTNHAWKEVSKTKRAKVIACLTGRHNRLGFSKKVSGGVPEQQALMLSLSAGARLAYAAMEADFRESVGHSESLIRKLWPDAQETFFMRFCLPWCSASHAPHTLTFKEMCLLPLYNMKEFGERYGCKSNSNYSAGPICDV